MITFYPEDPHIKVCYVNSLYRILIRGKGLVGYLSYEFYQGSAKWLVLTPQKEILNLVVHSKKQVYTPGFTKSLVEQAATRIIATKLELETNVEPLSMLYEGIGKNFHYIRPK